MKIVITDLMTVTNGDIDVNVFDQFGDIVRYEYTEYKDIPDRIKDADIVLCNKTKLDREVLQYAKNLKYIGLFATGYNNIDIEYAAERGIIVSNAGSYSTSAVAQQVFSYILEHYNNLRSYAKFVEDGKWKNSSSFSPLVYKKYELNGKTLGLIGYGNISMAVIRIAKAFNMNVLVNTRTPKNDYMVKFVSFDKLLQASDIVSVHCPLTNETNKMFNKAAFDKMKDGAFFINTARGGIVDEYALKEALESGKLSGAAIDVLETEPMKDDCILYNVKNLIITPHTAWIPIETRERLIKIVVENLRHFIIGDPMNVVNKKMLKTIN
jgi:glycerate dehydrogenase